MALACSVTAMMVSSPWTIATPVTSAPPAGLAYRRPARVLASTNPSRPKRRLNPSLVTASACVGGTSPSVSAAIPFITLGSRLTAFTTFSPSRNLKNRWIGSP